MFDLIIYTVAVLSSPAGTSTMASGMSAGCGCMTALSTLRRRPLTFCAESQAMARTAGIHKRLAALALAEPSALA